MMSDKLRINSVKIPLKCSMCEKIPIFAPPAGHVGGLPVLVEFQYRPPLKLYYYG